MGKKVSVVINTLNEASSVERAIRSVKWADEVINCDMYSRDQTVEIAKKLGAKVFFHKREDYVELARNFAISKASNNWILVLDPDEEIPETLADRLTEIATKMPKIDYVRVPRRNLIFGHPMQESMWWPDFNIRFFKKGAVKWSDKIHRPPEVSGQGLDLPAEEKYAIIHYSYETISQFLRRMDRYTTIQAQELKKEGKEFHWKDLFEKPLGEFLSRFFASRGYKDGLHGLALSSLQAFSFMIVYLKLWESNNFKEQEIDMVELKDEVNKSSEDINFWIKKISQSGNLLGQIFKRFKG